jgi:hypothetical protein
VKWKSSKGIEKNKRGQRSKQARDQRSKVGRGGAVWGGRKHPRREG